MTASIAPVLIGAGRRLLGGLDRNVHLTLRGAHAAADDGLVRVTYDIVPSAAVRP